MGYQEFDAPHFDYRLTPIEGLPLVWRGGDTRGDGPYAVCLGAAQTLGRFCHDPYPDQLSRALDMPVVNLGRGGIGPLFFLDDRFRPIVEGAEFVVVQVMSARSVGAPGFESRYRSDQGTRLRDCREMKAEEFLREEFDRLGREDFADLIEQIQDRYCAQMETLLREIRSPTVLLHVSTKPPQNDNSAQHFGKLMGPFPQLVTRPVLDRIRESADYSIEVVSTAGLPQQLWEADSEVPGADLQDGCLFNTYYPSPEIHTEIAQLLVDLVRKAQS